VNSCLERRNVEQSKNEFPQQGEKGISMPLLPSKNAILLELPLRVPDM
jgi:hypothetical protein